MGERRHERTQRVASLEDEQVEREWRRVEGHPTEYAVTLRLLDQHLPPPPAAVLVVGAGPGRYALALAKRGYAVTLIDMSGPALAYARRQAAAGGLELEGYLRRDARDVHDFADGTFDAVLLLGPLYHLPGEAARLEAVREARRVLRPDGVLIASFITRFAEFRRLATEEPDSYLKERTHFDRLLREGTHDRLGNAAPAYFAHPDEVEPLMRAGGFEPVATVGVEGIVAGHEGSVSSLSGDAWEAWVDLNLRLGSDQALWGAADHLVYVGRR